jgi:hypothetical protein
VGFLRPTMGLKYMKVNLHFEVNFDGRLGNTAQIRTLAENGLEEREKRRPVFVASRSKLESPIFYENMLIIF